MSFSLNLSTIIVVTLGIFLYLTQHSLCQFEEDDDPSTFNSISLNPPDDTPTTDNEITLFSTTITSNLKPPRPNKYYHNFQPLLQFQNKNKKKKINQTPTDLGTRNNNGSKERKNLRLLKFLRHFRLDFSKFDSTCIKRIGRGVPAPFVTNAQVSKYTRRRNRSPPRNRYAMALYECKTGFAFPPESADRMFCSKTKWVGPRPVCLPIGTLHESECNKCEQICNMDSSREDGLSTLCSCYSGYEMVNDSCTDTDECKINNGGCFGICYNKPGSFQCFCPSGFQVGPDGKGCIDRNECLLRNGHGPCQDSCTNTIGSYTCSCERISGTKLAVDKHSCEDTNECEDGNNFGCSHRCLNTFGNAFCACPEGLVLSTIDYKTCLPQVDIEDENENLVPENLMESSQPPLNPPDDPDPIPIILNTGIECPAGSTPDSENQQICVEHEDCSIENGGCDHNCIPSGSFRFCSCRLGFELINETSCMDLNECEQENGGCDHTCVNAHGSFNCECKEGYHLAQDLRTCKVKFCDDPPTISKTSRWDCELPDGNHLSSQEKSTIGTECKLRCLPGYIPQQLNPNIHQSDSLYERFQYELVNDEPRILGKPADQIIIKCTNNGEWSPNGLELIPVTCAPTHCPKLRNLEHGSLFPEHCLQEEGVPLHMQCLVLCSTGFYPKNGRIRTCSKNLRWFPEDTPICLRLPPTPRPYIHCPSDLVVDLKAAEGSAHVRIPQPQANMDWYRYVEADPPWAKSLEWDVPAGVTEIVFTARSPLSNDTATCHFKIHIVDREAPRVQGCPTSFEIRLSPGETSKEVWWSEPKFTDNVKLHYVQQSHNPGHLLTRGSHHITYVAGDAEANKARCAFTITVHSTEDYEMADYSYYPNNVDGGRHMIICPNLKTGRWNMHFAYYLPPGCRYHSQSQGILSKLFKQNVKQGHQSSARVSRRAARRSFYRN